MNITAFIPARSLSKTIKDKNTKLLGGKPLIAWSIETAISLGLKPVVSTDSQQYAEIAKQYGAEVLIRPESLAQDKTKMYDVLASELPRIEPKPEVVLLLQPTTPLRKLNQIKIALSYFENNPEYDSLISVERVPEKYNPAVMLVKTLEGIKMANGLPISQRITDRQSNPEVWLPTGAIYLFKASNLEKGNLYGAKTMLLEGESMININSQADWDEAEKYLEKIKCKS